MDILSSYSAETEAKRILITLQLVAKGFYLKNGFYVLPSILDEIFRKRTIILPELDYLSFVKNWKQYAYEFNELGEYEHDPILVKTLAGALVKTKPEINIYNGLTDFEKSVIAVMKPALQIASQSLPYLKGKRITFDIHPTLFGSCGSFHFHDFIHTNRKQITLDLYIRIDQQPQVVLELLASALTRGVMEGNKNNSWRDTEAVSDFFTKYIFGAGSNHKGTIDSLAGTDVVMLRSSIEYLSRISAPTGEVIHLDPETKRLFVREKQINNLLSPIEYAFLRILVQNPNTCITFDQLTDVMYQTNADSKYSLWGIRKTAQRVREKLETLGIPPALIDSVKGEGFMLRM